MSILIKLDDLLVDALLLGRIITKKDIVFQNPAIVQKALEKGIKVFEKIPQMSQVSKTDCPKNNATPGEVVSQIKELHRKTILSNNKEEVAYIETIDNNIINDTQEQEVKEEVDADAKKEDAKKVEVYAVKEEVAAITTAINLMNNKK